MVWTIAGATTAVVALTVGVAIAIAIATATVIATAAVTVGATSLSRFHVHKHIGWFCGLYEHLLQLVVFDRRTHEWVRRGGTRTLVGRKGSSGASCTTEFG